MAAHEVTNWGAAKTKRKKVFPNKKNTRGAGRGNPPFQGKEGKRRMATFWEKKKDPNLKKKKEAAKRREKKARNSEAPSGKRLTSDKKDTPSHRRKASG